MAANFMLNEHPHNIFQGNDGRWRTYVNMSDGRRKLIAKSTKEKLEEAVTDFYMRNQG